MEAKEIIEATQEMIANGTFHIDTDFLALGLTGQLRNNDGRIEFVDREGKATEVKCFDSKFDQEPGTIIIGPSGAGRAFFVDELIRQAQEENPSFSKEDAIRFIHEKYEIQTIKDEQ